MMSVLSPVSQTTPQLGEALHVEKKEATVANRIDA